MSWVMCATLLYRVLLPSNLVGGLIPGVCFQMSLQWLDLGLSLVLADCELGALIFITSKYVYLMGFFSVLVHCMSYL